MRKRLLVLSIAVLFLFTIPYLGSQNDVPLVQGGYEADFSTSADSDESTESITSFSETLADDTFYYPDGITNSTEYEDSTSGDYYLDLTDTGYDTDNTHTKTHVDNGAEPDTDEYWGIDHSFLAGDNKTGAFGLRLHFTISNDVFYPSFVYLDYQFLLYDSDGDEVHTTYCYIHAYNYEETQYDLFLTPTEELDYNQDTLALNDSYVSSAGDVEVRLYMKFENVEQYDIAQVRLDYAYLYVDWTPENGYAESFADVSDWSTSDTSITSDGDLATITENGAGSTGRAYASFSSTDYFEYYYEFSIDSMTATTASLQFYDGSSWHTLQTFTAAGTYKGIISSSDASTMERIGFQVGSDGDNIKPDYLRIGPSTEMGWQHDGSTTAGLSEWNGEDWAGAWNFETGSGTTAYDQSDNSNDGTITGATWTSGKVGDYALEFDGDGDYVDDMSLDFNTTDTFSFSTWVNIEGYTERWSSIVYVGASGGSYGISRKDNSFYFGIRDEENNYRFATYNYNFNQWYHVVGVFDGTYNYLYVDGSYEDVSGEVTGYITDTSLTFGDAWATGTGSKEYLNGTIDEVQIYDRALSADEVYALYQHGEGSTGSISSDGAEVTLTAGSLGSTYALVADTTATQSRIDTDYYPMFGIDFNDGDSSDYVQIDAYSGSGIYTVLSNSTIGTDTLYCNPEATVTESEVQSWRIYVPPSATVRVNWAKAYSIANYTLTESSTTINDYLYVSDAVLYSSMTSGTIELNHDPAVSVGDAYSVWNLTTAGTSPEFSQYVSSWTSYSSETRGATTSGTVTDVKIRFDGTESLSAITFIEDATAPDILDKYIDPKDPADDEAVTLTVVAFDAVEVYSLTINAVVSPTDFTDTDYAMTETAQEHVFTYEFSTLTAGYYLFMLTADDGANTYAEYISVRVRLGEITISPITFFGVGEDFTQMQMSFEINRDCSYTIYEASASYPISDTHTGSVRRGWSNIAWDKISVDDTAANFSIQFTNGSLSTWVNGSYSIAQTTFYVEQWNVISTTDEVVVSGRITKTASYTVYDDSSTVQATGSISDLDFRIRFTQWTTATNERIDFAIMLTNGSQTCWLNSSYFALDYEALEGFGGVPDSPDQQSDRARIEFWAFLASFFALGALIIVLWNRITGATS